MSITPTTRASLLMKLRDPRDHEAWVEFVSLYEPVIYRLLRKAGLEDVDARDVLQELLLAVSRNIERWRFGREHGSFRGWLRRVTRNLVISWIRRQKRQVVTLPVDLDSLLESSSIAVGPDTDAFDAELRRSQFHRASETVRQEVQPRTWEAFWEVAIVGTSVADAAVKLGMTTGAVRVAKCRVVARLREVVTNMEREI